MTALLVKESRLLFASGTLEGRWFDDEMRLVTKRLSSAGSLLPPDIFFF
jgi:hypothetical protein